MALAPRRFRARPAAILELFALAGWVFFAEGLEPAICLVERAAGLMFHSPPHTSELHPDELERLGRPFDLGADDCFGIFPRREFVRLSPQ
jgi:hypothetical protein